MIEGSERRRTGSDLTVTIGGKKKEKKGVEGRGEMPKVKEKNTILQW